MVDETSDNNMQENSSRGGEGSEVMDRSTGYQIPRHTDKKYSTMQTIVLAYQSLGIAYGDLGTSPVNVFSSTNMTNLTEDDLLGTLSLIIWALTLLVLIKYVFIVLHANDRGEGGTFALYSYIRRHIDIGSTFMVQDMAVETDNADTVMYHRRRNHLLAMKTKKFLERSGAAQTFLMTLVLLGTCMVIGDGALTPATCVLSALQGIQSHSAKITQDHVVWLSVVLLVALFAFQHCGTSKVSFFFAPIMLLWFATNVSIGVYNIVKFHPSILKAVSPHYIVKFSMKNGKTTWDILGAVFLAITGAEAMFADLGHFNKRAIQLAFSFVVYPSLVISYAGEAAYLVKNPWNISNAYYGSIPDSVYWPMLVISTLAAVVSSQSMISACFSIIKQSLILGCFPRVTIIHVSSEYEGQVYSPEINYILMILTVGLIVGFRGGVELTNAYGLVVIWVMIITTFLTAIVMLLVWKTNPILVLGFFAPYMLIEIVFMASSLNKIPQGGWVPFIISAIFLTIMLSWTYGTSKKTMYEAERKMSIDELDHMLSNNVHRASGMCFFITNLIDDIPPIVRHYIHHTNSVQEIMVIVTTRNLPIKTVNPNERFQVEKLGRQGAYRCSVWFGYKDSPNMKGDDECSACMVTKLRQISDAEDEMRRIEVAAQQEPVFVIGKAILKSNRENGVVARFTIDYLYRFLEKNSKTEVSSLGIPSERLLQIGMLYEI